MGIWSTSAELCSGIRHLKDSATPSPAVECIFYRLDEMERMKNITAHALEKKFGDQRSTVRETKDTSPWYSTMTVILRTWNLVMDSEEQLRPHLFGCIVLLVARILMSS